MSATPARISHARGPAPRPGRYRARRPDNTPLYHAVQNHLESWLALKRAGEPWEDTVPAFVERDFRKYLQCGLFCQSHPASTEPEGGEGHYCSPARYLWAMLIARIYETFPLSCAQCGTEMRIIAFVRDTASVTRILEHIGEPTKAPVLSPARGPPGWEEAFDQTPVFDPVVPAPEPVFEFDQSVTW